MNPEEASGIGCISFDAPEMSEAFSEVVFHVHTRIAGCGRCFNPLNMSDSAARKRAVGRVQSVVESVFGTFFGQTPDERYGGDIFVQVATFCHHLANDHIFADGNKRTALVMSIFALRLKGVLIPLEDSSVPEDNEAYTFIQDVVAGAKTLTELADEMRRIAQVDGP